VINVTLQGPKRTRIFTALVDSGASFSVFKPEVAELLGVRIERGKQIYLEGIGGRILGYIHKINLGIDKKFSKYKIVFSRELIISFNLLGRDNFFLPFLITFFEKGRKVIIVD
jgi:hypothetical protein